LSAPNHQLIAGVAWVAAGALMLELGADRGRKRERWLPHPSAGGRAWWLIGSRGLPRELKIAKFRGMKQFTIVAALVFAVACKTDAPSQQKAAPTGEDTSAKARSAKIEVKPQPPTAPELPVPSTESAEPPPASEPPAGDNPMPSQQGRGGRDAHLDTNGDGVVSSEEREVGLQERAVNLHKRFDRDGDGKLSLDELMRSRMRRRFSDPVALDTNNDGDISAEELAAGFRARAEARDADDSEGSATP
jgi:hypothetical protein